MAKLKNVKKSYKKRIVKGWRHYLDLKIPYNLIGETNDKFLSIEDIERLTGLEWTGEDSGFVDHYIFYDHSKTHKGVPLTVNLNLCYEFTNDDKIPEHLEDNIAHVIHNDKIYYIGGTAGYRDPKCVWDENKSLFPKGEPYWLYEDDEEYKSHDWVWTFDGTKDDLKVKELIERYKNNDLFRESIFSGNFTFKLVSGKWDEPEDDLFRELSYLSEYCKTTYEKFERDRVVVTFAIRYSDNVEPFLRDLKKIIKKYKIKF